MAVKGGIEIIKALARKLITRDQTGIKRIPTRMEAESEAGAIAAQIQQATGLRPSQLDAAIKREEQVLSILNDLEYRSALSKQKESLKEFTKKEDVYEGMIDPKSDLGKKLAKLRRRGDETEQQLKLRMERENKEAAERIRKKKAEEELRREFPGIDDRLIKNILVDKNPQRIAEVKQTMREALKMQEKGMSPDEIIKIFKDTTRTKQASGGIAGQLHLNEGGRVRFDKGGMSRRNFMKLIGGLAALPVVGKFFKFAKPAAKIAQLKKTTTTMPAWFPDFVDKMVTKNVGNKIDADAMLYKDKDLPGVELYKYSDGRVEVRGKNAYDSDFDINYTPPGYELIDETTGKAVKNPGDFQASDTMYTKVGPENDFSVDAEIVDDIEDILGGDSIFLEGYAKGTGKAKYTKGQRRIDEADAMNERADEIYYEADYDDFAKGGLAGVLKL